MTITAHPTLQEFITYESARLERRQLPNEPLLYVLQNEFMTTDGLWTQFGVHSDTTINLIARHTSDTVYGFVNSERHRSQVRSSFDSGLPEVDANVELIPGEFDETLPEFLDVHPIPVAFAHLDCGSYSSTVNVLTHLRPRLSAGSVIVFGGLFNRPDYERHALNAFYEFLSESDLECEWIGVGTPIELVPRAEVDERTDGGAAVVVLSGPTNSRT